MYELYKISTFLAWVSAENQADWAVKSLSTSRNKSTKPKKQKLTKGDEMPW